MKTESSTTWNDEYVTSIEDSIAYHEQLITLLDWWLGYSRQSKTGPEEKGSMKLSVQFLSTRHNNRINELYRQRRLLLA